MRSMSVVHALWVSAGMPEPNWQGKATKPVPVPAARPGICALTGERGNVWPLAKVSTTLTSIDRLRWRNADPTGIALGPVGAWAFRLRLAMQQPHGIDRHGVFRALDPADLHDALVRLPNERTGWVGVPQSRQKHLLPWAEPGTVQVDNETLEWTAADVDRLRTYGALRSVGFGETALAEAEPRFVILAKTAEPAHVLATWHHLDAWREHPALLDVAARATRTTKETDDDSSADQ